MRRFTGPEDCTSCNRLFCFLQEACFLLMLSRGRLRFEISGHVVHRQPSLPNMFPKLALQEVLITVQVLKFLSTAMKHNSFQLIMC